MDSDTFHERTSIIHDTETAVTILRQCIADDPPCKGNTELTFRSVWVEMGAHVTVWGQPWGEGG